MIDDLLQISYNYWSRDRAKHGQDSSVEAFDEWINGLSNRDLFQEISECVQIALRGKLDA